MELSRVYVNLNYVMSLSDTRGRRQLLRTITSAQTKAIGEVSKRIVNGTINPLRHDVRICNRKRMVLRMLVSERISVTRKHKALIRNHTLLPTLLRSAYLLPTSMDERRPVQLNPES